MKEATRYTDLELFALIASGNEIAYRQFYDRHWNRIFSTAVTYLKSAPAAEDVVQEVFLKLWSKRATLKEVDNPAGYLYIMCRNMLINSLHRQLELNELTEQQIEVLPGSLLHPHQVVDIKELSEKINAAVLHLPPQQQTIFRLSREQGLNHEEIAARLGIEKTTVKNHIVRALNNLRTSLSVHEYIMLLVLLTHYYIKS